MRLTAELVQHSLSYNNPLDERELDLRGHKIPAIENLGVAKDHECIDFTDNAIQTLGNFPLSPRLQTLLCAQNRISSISESAHQSLPNLRTLVLTQNSLSELSDLIPLRGFSRLTYVSLVDNPVASKENYRYWLLWNCPHVRFLDFQKVKDAERSKAKELFGAAFDAPTELAQGIAAVHSTRGVFDVPAAHPAKKLKITDDEKQRFQELVKKASSFAEIQHLEKMYNEGRLPALGDAMDHS